MDAPIVFRILAQAELADKGYALVDSGRIDEALREKGILEAGQIDSLTPRKLARLSVPMASFTSMFWATAARWAYT